MKLSLTEGMLSANKLLHLLQQNGYEAVFVGGAVRDLLLNRPVNDIDIATSATPDEVMKLFPKCIPTGIQHGTVTVMQDGASYEVTTYRTEAAYVDYRKPSEVRFIRELDGDLQRRDFTMNAMAIQTDGSLYDPYHGREHLFKKQLRCVGDAESRFQEDALRMLRAVRFAGVYRLKPSLALWRALRTHCHLLKHVAMERVEAELMKMLESGETLRSLVWLAASGLMEHTKEPLLDRERLAQLREWADHRHIHSASGGELDRFANVNRFTQAEDKLAHVLLLMKLNEQEMITICEALRFSKKRKAFLLSIRRIHVSLSIALEESASKLQERWIDQVVRYGEEACRSWLRLSRFAMQRIDEWRHSESLNQLTAILEQMPIKTLKELDVNGSELALHVERPPGAWMKTLLQVLLLRTAAGQIPNEKAELLKFAEKWMTEDDGKGVSYEH